eukprot:1753786-Rhodomonas_salina.2
MLHPDVSRWDSTQVLTAHPWSVVTSPGKYCFHSRGVLPGRVAQSQPVYQWMLDRNLTGFAQKFRENEITGKILLRLNSKILTEDLGVPETFEVASSVLLSLRDTRRWHRFRRCAFCGKCDTEQARRGIPGCDSRRDFGAVQQDEQRGELDREGCVRLDQQLRWVSVAMA